MRGSIVGAIAANLGKFAIVALCAILAAAQDDNTYGPEFGKSYQEKTRSASKAKSRAQLEADRLVSLSADKIVSLLMIEPGLLLQCKRLLVRTAYEQGRILDPEDLTDDTVYQLVREDRNTRVLFTQEIEDRYYVRAKPTKEEVEEDWFLGLVPVNPSGPNSARPLPSTADNALQVSQEDLYWLRHEDDLQRTPSPATTSALGSQAPTTSGAASSATNPNRGTGAPSVGTQPGTPQLPMQNQPQGNPTPDARRQLLQAQSSQAFGGSFGSSGIGSMSRISPDQMSGLIAAKLGVGGNSFDSSMLGNSLGSSGGRSGMSSLDAYKAMGPLSGIGASGLTPGLGSGFSNPGTQYPQQASLDFNGMSSPPWLPPVYVDRQTPLRHRPNPYADVPALYDLYQQYAHRSPILDRFGIDIFQNGTGNFDQLPMDMPVGPDYVLGPGDDVTIDLTGSVSDRLHQTVDREGRLMLPDAGGVQVSGRALGDVQQLVQRALRTQYRDVQVDLSIARIRTVRIYVVGDVQRPGAYDVSSLSTVLNAIYEAGGPTSAGSLRILNHYRGQQLVEKVDVYDLLIHGVRAGMQRLQAGDTVMVPPLGPQVTVEGMVRRPAIYEINSEKTLTEILELAGGVLPTGTLRHVDVERIAAHDTRSMLRLDIPENDNSAEITNALDSFQIQDGDRVQISPILPYAEKTVYLAGHVFRPGKFAYRDGMKVTDLVKSYKDVLPEPYKRHAEIIRLRKPDNTPEVIAFNLEDALAGKDQDPLLQPFDTVRIFGRFDFEDAPLVTVTGEVRDPGDHVTNGATYLRDAVYLAGGVTPEALLGDAQVFRSTEDGKLKVFNVNLSKALNGEPDANILLSAKDRVFIHKDLNKTDPAVVTVEGEVGHPGKYPLGNGMTAAELVHFAGGLKRSAYTQEADLTTYQVQDGQKVIGEHRTVEIAKALAGEPETDVRLHDGDVLTIRELSGWKDMGAVIMVKGEVGHPGTYGIHPGERLSSILARAGGFADNAYPYGAVLERREVRELQEKNRSQLVQRVQSEASSIKLLPTMETDQQLSAKAALLQYRSTIENLQRTPPSGRLVIHVSSSMKRWANTPADVQVRDGDVLIIPKKPNVVLVDGAVYNPTGITFKPGKNAGWYLHQAGGPTQMADRKGAFVVRADGSVVGGAGGLFSGGVESVELRPGDMVVMPERVYSFNNNFKTVVQSAQIAASVGLAAYYIARF